jgi:hypothetical protein
MAVVLSLIAVAGMLIGLGAIVHGTAQALRTTLPKHHLPAIGARSGNGRSKADEED